jgi:hypothetical protein
VYFILLDSLFRKEYRDGLIFFPFSTGENQQATSRTYRPFVSSIFINKPSCNILLERHSRLSMISSYYAESHNQGCWYSFWNLNGDRKAYLSIHQAWPVRDASRVQHGLTAEALANVNFKRLYTIARSNQNCELHCMIQQARLTDNESASAVSLWRNHFQCEVII